MKYDIIKEPNFHKVDAINDYPDTSKLKTEVVKYFSTYEKYGVNKSLNNTYTKEYKPLFKKEGVIKSIF